MKNTLDMMSKHAHWLLRAALAAVFMFHGAEKLMSLDKTTAMMQMPFIIVTLVACAEFFGGLLILIGGFTKDWITRVGGAFISIVMLGAFILVHSSKGFSMATGGFEYVMTLFCIAMYFVLTGNKFGGCDCLKGKK